MMRELIQRRGRWAGVLLVGFIGIVSVPRTVQAVVVNGGFETGDFTGWLTVGDANIATVAFGSGPTEGVFQALLNSGSSGSSFSGTSPVSATELETFFGYAPGTLDALIGNTVMNGSAIAQTFSGSAGDVLSFDWNFLTNEETSPGDDPSNIDFNDFAFVTIGPSVLADMTFPTFTGSLTTAYSQETGFSTFAYTLPAPGAYTLGFGVANVSDDAGASGLLVDQVSLKTTDTSGNPVVPEPASLMLFGLGGLGALGFRRRRR